MVQRRGWKPVWGITGQALVAGSASGMGAVYSMGAGLDSLGLMVNGAMKHTWERWCRAVGETSRYGPDLV